MIFPSINQDKALLFLRKTSKGIGKKSTSTITRERFWDIIFIFIHPNSFHLSRKGGETTILLFKNKLISMFIWRDKFCPLSNKIFNPMIGNFITVTYHKEKRKVFTLMIRELLLLRMVRIINKRIQEIPWNNKLSASLRIILLTSPICDQWFIDSKTPIREIILLWKDRNLKTVYMTIRRVSRRKSIAIWIFRGFL